MLEFRLKAFERFKQLKEPDWQKPKYPKIDYQDLYYYSAPKSMDDKPKSLDELDPKLLETYKKLGIPLQEQARLNGLQLMQYLTQSQLPQLLEKSYLSRNIFLSHI
jgi:Fe-S cluster assembly protein SufB